MTGFHLYQLHLKFMFLKNYCYIIVDKTTNLAAAIDPAWELKTIELFLKKINAKLDKILLTHSHFDHVNLVKPLLKKYNPQVIMSSKEIDFYKFKCNNLIPIENGDILELGNTNIKCLLTPGHTIGSTCFLLDDCLFTGDTIFTEGCGICNAFGGSPEDMFYSLEMIKNTISPDVLIYPAHSFGKTPGYPLKYLLKENTYLKINNLEHFISYRMRKKQKNNFKFR